MDVAQPTNAGVGQYELRGLQGAETSAPQQEQRKSVQPDLFMHSQSSVRDDYKSWNSSLSAVCLSVCLSVSATLLLWIDG